MVELVILAHFTFIAWVALGGLAALKWRWGGFLHMPALVWAVLLELNGWICPLTPLENTLRAGRGIDVYDTGFIERYLLPIIYPEGLTREIQVGLAVALALVNGAIYAIVIYKHVFKQVEPQRNG